MVDPAGLRMNEVVPPVYVETLRADRQDYAIAAPVNLPARSRDIEISYTALSLAVPEKVRFRYRLDGRDQDWNDAGTRRQAFYSDLPPGQYRFQVTASNNDGVWNEQGATLAFVIAPAYYQTGWFMALIAGVLVTAVWTAHRVRLRIVERNQRDMSALNERLMKAQEQERVRIAGELHDGVMQEMLAATMMLGSAKRRTPDDSEAHGTIDKVQQKLIKMGTDLRQLSHELHPPALQEAGLPKAVQDYCEEFSTASGIPGIVPYRSRRGRSLARDLAGAVPHPSGSTWQCRQALRRPGGSPFGWRETASMVSLAIADDGVGFDRSLLGPSRGLGLITIRERAAQLNGKFEVDTAPGRGTTITVVIPIPLKGLRLRHSTPIDTKVGVTRAANPLYSINRARRMRLPDKGLADAHPRRIVVRGSSGRRAGTDGRSPCAGTIGDRPGHRRRRIGGGRSRVFVSLC